MPLAQKLSASVSIVSLILSTASPIFAAGRSTQGRAGGDDGSRRGALATQALGGFSFPLAPQIEETDTIDLGSHLAGQDEAIAGLRDAIGRSDAPIVLGPTGVGRSSMPEAVKFMGRRLPMDEQAPASEALGAAQTRASALGTGEIFGETRRGVMADLPVAEGGAIKPADVAPESAKVFMKEDLNLSETILHGNYAPGSKKHERFGWNLHAVIETAKQSVDAMAGMTLRDYWGVHKHAFDTTRDYHVATVYNSTEASSLPFLVKGEKDPKDGLIHYHLMFIDRNLLPHDSFPFEEGDELVSFGGKPTRQAVQELQDQMVANKERTDRGLASLYLTVRRGARALATPNEPIDIEVLRKDGTRETRQMMWTHSEETVEYALSQLRGLQSQDFQVRGDDLAQAAEVDVRDMLSPVIENFRDQATGKNLLEGNPHGLGNRDGFLPKLGEVVQDLTTENFQAYIYKDKQGRKLGYLRIGNYTPQDADAALEEFAGIVQKLEAQTEGLTIDQQNNPGGSVFYLYALASMLTGQTLATPKHQIAINPQQVAQAQKLLQAARMVKNDAMARQALGPTFGGFPTSYQLVQFLAKWASDIVEEWHLGHALTKPIHMYGVDKINASTKAKYTKPIIIAVNELDFSGGDFFPFIMAMNGRAKLFGVETAGAGGFVLQFKYPNVLGVDTVHFTGSTTDVENNSGHITYRYEATTEDLKTGYRPMADALIAAMDQELLENKIEAFAKAHLQEIISVRGVVAVGPAKFFDNEGPTLVIMFDPNVSPEDAVRRGLLARLPDLASVPYKLWAGGPIVPQSGATAPTIVGATTAAEFERLLDNPALARRITAPMTVIAPAAMAPVPPVTDVTKSAIQRVFDELKSKAFAGVQWVRGILIGRYASLELGQDPDGTKYSAMIRVGELAPNAPVRDPNSVGRFFLVKTDASGARVHSTHSFEWPIAPAAPREALRIEGFDLEHPLTLGDVAWMETAPEGASGMRNAIRFTFYDSKGNMLQLQLPEPGNSFGGAPVFKFAPPGLTEEQEHLIRDYPILRSNIGAASALMQILLEKSEPWGERAAEIERIGHEVDRRFELIATTEPQPESFPVEGGLAHGLLNIAPERAREVWTKASRALAVPPGPDAHYHQISRPTPEEFARMRDMPRFTVSMDGADHRVEVYVKDDHTAIYEQWNPNPNWDRYFEVSLD